MDKTIYTITGAGDLYTIESQDKETACAVCLMLGEHRYGLVTSDIGSVVMPVDTKYGVVPLDWFCTTFGITLDDHIDKYTYSFVDCLESIIIGDLQTRLEISNILNKMPKGSRGYSLDKVRMLNSFEQSKRRSFNDLSAYARRLALTLRGVFHGPAIAG